MSFAVLALLTVDQPTEISVVTDLDELFRAHYGRLVRSLTVASGDREVAADAVQEAFVKAHLRWKRLRDYDDPIGWIRRVAINHLRDDHRRSTRKRRAVERLASTTPTTVDEPMPPDDELVRLLSTLPRQQRLCIAMFYVEGLPIAEISATLGVSDGAVKYHLHQGRERLRAPLSGDDRATGAGR